ncbi:insulysin [Mytilus galloprovincialis]|uniref:Insulysin n=1 Tax=Mytilus galloprovincialis TaxID=29158 RepID=A0A8B6CN73_MYTGA|nr:insulysin [Mytilus galloprovincialis]
MLKREGPQQWIFDEFKDLSAMTFRFKGKEKPRNYTTQITSRVIHKYSLSEVLSGPYLMSEFQPDLITMVLDKLQPDRMRHVSIFANSGSIAEIKGHYVFWLKFLVEVVFDEKMIMWSKCGENENLTLPEKNDFIPTDFELVTRKKLASLPELIKDSAMTQLWFKQDDTYVLPKACINFELISSLGRSDPVNCNLMYLFVSLFKDALNEYAYDAELAGLHYGLECTIYGMSASKLCYSTSQFN